MKFVSKNTMSQAALIPLSEHIETLDVLRGFALLGIMPTNVYIFMHAVNWVRFVELTQMSHKVSVIPQHTKARDEICETTPGLILSHKVNFHQLYFV